MDGNFCGNNVLIYILFTIAFCSCAEQKDNRVEWVGTTYGLIRKEYYENTIISRKSYRKDSFVQEGNAKFYKDGKLKIDLNVHLFNLVGSHTEYYDNGNPSLFICHDGIGDTAFIRRYDTSGNVSYEKGKIGTTTFLDTNGMSKDSILHEVILVIKPPHASISLVDYFLYNNKQDTLWPQQTRIDYDWAYFYSYIIPRAGEFEHYIYRTVFDSTTFKNYSEVNNIIYKFN